MKKVLFVSLIVVAISVLVAVQSFTQGPPAGGAPGGGRQGGPPAEQMMIMQTLPLESAWTYISFEMGVGDATLIKLRKAYQEAYTQRKTNITDKMESARGDANALRTLKSDADKIKASLDAKLKSILSIEEMAKLTKWENENKDRMRRFQSQPRQGTGQQRPNN